MTNSHCEAHVDLPSTHLSCRAIWRHLDGPSSWRQRGARGTALAKSIGRLPAGPVTPASLEGTQPGRVPASLIGAALDLLRRFEEN